MSDPCLGELMSFVSVNEPFRLNCDLIHVCYRALSRSFSFTSSWVSKLFIFNKATYTCVKRQRSRVLLNKQWRQNDFSLFVNHPHTNVACSLLSPFEVKSHCSGDIISSRYQWQRWEQVTVVKVTVSLQSSQSSPESKLTSSMSSPKS